MREGLLIWRAPKSAETAEEAKLLTASATGPCPVKRACTSPTTNARPAFAAWRGNVASDDAADSNALVMLFEMLIAPAFTVPAAPITADPSL